MPKTERWLPIADYEELYEVSDHGRVRSLPRCVPDGRWGNQRFYPSRVLCPGYSKRLGYRHVSLSKNGKGRSKLISRLVLHAFVQPPFPKEHAAHCNGDHAYNYLTNLRWATAKENCADKKLHGRNNEKISADNVSFVRRFAGILSQARFAAILGCHPSTISRIQGGLRRAA